MFGSFSEQLSGLLSDFFTDKPDSAKRLCAFLRPRVSRFCATHASNLPADLREDVLQECMLVLFASGRQKFRAEDGTSAGYVFNTIRTALQSVRRRHGLPQDVFVEAESGDGVDLIAIATTSITASTIPTPAHWLDQHMAAQALRVAGPEMGSLLWRIYVDGEPRDAVLRDTMLSRFAFERRRKTLAKTLRTLPKCA